MLEEKEAIEEKLAISEYELRLAQEDISKFKIELQKKNEAHSVELSGKYLFSISDFEELLPERLVGLEIREESSR